MAEDIRYATSVGEVEIAYAISGSGPLDLVYVAGFIRDTLAVSNVPLRSGLHTCEIDSRGDDIGGIGVHIAARIAARAGPGEVLVSRTVRDLVAGSDLSFEDCGEHTLKGVAEPWQIYAVGN